MTPPRCLTHLAPPKNFKNMVNWATKETWGPLLSIIWLVNRCPKTLNPFQNRSTSHQEFHTLSRLCPSPLSFVLTVPQHSKVPGNCRFVCQGSCFAFFFFSCFRLSCWQLQKRLKEIPACLVPTGTGNHQSSILCLISCYQTEQNNPWQHPNFQLPHKFATFVHMFFPQRSQWHKGLERSQRVLGKK